MSVISAHPPKFSNKMVEKIALEIYGFEVSASKLESERDQNYKIICKDGKNYIFKISNPHEDIELIKLQSAAQEHIHAYDQSLNVPIPIESIDGKTIHHVDGNIIRVQSYLSGKFIKDIENPTSQLLSEFGKFLGKLDFALKEFDYPEIDKDWVWDVRNIDFLKSHFTYIENQKDQQVISLFIQNYELNIIPIEKHLRRQYIHNDGNDHNVLLNEKGEISGIIDFGDMAHTFLVSELAVAITYLILEEENPQEMIRAVVDGYQSILPLRDEEVNSLIHLICIRACFTVVTANYRKKLFPENKYISVTEPKAWEFLMKMVDKDIKKFKLLL